MKAPGKSSFTMFVDLGIYQPGGSGDTIPITGEERRYAMGWGPETDGRGTQVSLRCVCTEYRHELSFGPQLLL